MSVKKKVKEMKDRGGYKALTEWEQRFCESILSSKYDSLTYRQEPYFERIMSKTSPERMSDLALWQRGGGYTEERKAIAQIVAPYYLKGKKYFYDLAKQVMEGKELSFGQYKAMCENKYAKAIVEAHRAKPKYKEGDQVFVTANIKGDSSTLKREYFRKIRGLQGKPLFILEVNAETPMSPAKGAKLYRVLPIGSEPVLIEERNLKKRK